VRQREPSMRRRGSGGAMMHTVGDQESTCCA
jgi:hypothetical protein